MYSCGRGIGCLGFRVFAELVPHNLLSHVDPVLLPSMLLKVFDFELRVEDYANDASSVKTESMHRNEIHTHGDTIHIGKIHL